jgi:hypothetical protein
MLKNAVLSVMILALASTAFAATQYDDEPSFLANLASPYYLEDFVGWSYGDPLDGSQTDYDFGPVEGYSWHAYATNGLWSNLGALSTNNSGDPLVITFTGLAVTALGGNFTATDISGNVIPGTVLIDLSDGTHTELINPTASTFTGYTSAVPITSVTIDSLDDDGINRWPQLDHFYVGSMIPEPASLVLLGLGTLLLRRR